MLTKKFWAVVLGVLSSCTESYAQSAGAPVSASAAFMQTLPMLLIFIAVFYFLLIRPQSKKQKEQRELLNSVKVGDEVVTTAGIMARISKIKDDAVLLAISEQMTITMKKSAIAAILPKGTLKSIS